MRFHLPSFLLGAAVGASGASLAPRFKPVFVELATGAYRVFDAMMLRVARSRENVSDLLAEAKARARETFHRNGAAQHGVEHSA